MTATNGHDHKIAEIFKSAIISVLVLAPSALTGMYLLDKQLPLSMPYLISCLILGLASINLALVIMLEPYRRYFSKLTPPALIGVVTIVLLYVITGALDRFFEHLRYGFLTPFVVACIALIYTAVFLEKNILLKCLHSLNSIAVMFLWALGSIDKVAMPF